MSNHWSELTLNCYRHFGIYFVKQYDFKNIISLHVFKYSSLFFGFVELYIDEIAYSCN
jgi:hypothetical protein